MDMHTQVRVLERMLRTETGLKFRLQIGAYEFQAAAFRTAEGDWQLSLLPPSPLSHPVVRFRVGESSTSDALVNIDVMEAILLAVAGSMADTLTDYAKDQG